MRITDIKGKLIILAISIIFALCISEFIVRKLKLAPSVINRVGYCRLIDNPWMVYELIPGAHIDSSIINKQGFKDADFTVEKGNNIMRIAMLGDSITEGMKVPLGKTFSDCLEKTLNLKAENQKSKFRYEVMNFGVVGYNLAAEVELLKVKVIKYSPDIVILNLAPNDNEPFPGLYFWFLGDNKLSEKQRYLVFKRYYSGNGSMVIRLLHKSKLYLLVMERLSRINRNTSGFSAFIINNHSSEVSAKESEMMYKNLSQIKQLSDKYNFKLLICLHSALLASEPSNTLKFYELTKKIGVPSFRIFEYYKRNARSPGLIQLSPDDYCHPNEYGHSIIADAMFIELKKNNFIDLS